MVSKMSVGMSYSYSNWDFRGLRVHLVLTRIGLVVVKAVVKSPGKGLPSATVNFMQRVARP